MLEFKMPKLGADMDQGTLLEWNIAPGDAVKKGDTSQVRAYAHTLKGITGNVSALSLQKAAARIEFAARIGDRVRLTVYIPEFEKDLTIFKKEVKWQGF